MDGRPVKTKAWLNRQRWAIAQRTQARSAFTPPDPAQKLAELRTLAASLEAFPHMADTLAAIRAEIERTAPRAPKPDPREPDHSRSGIFVYHNCSRCQHGTKPCVAGNPNRCEYPHARND